VTVMNEGKAVQVDGPARIYQQPADAFVGGFIGDPPMNFLEATAEEGGALLRLTGAGGDTGLVPPEPVEVPTDRKVLVGFRAEDVTVLHEPREGAPEAKVEVLEHMGAHQILVCRCHGAVVKVRISPDEAVEEGSRIWLAMRPDRISYMAAESGRRLGLRAGA
jgi:multiple sugar transport system ATP-binding protein